MRTFVRSVGTLAGLAAVLFAVGALGQQAPGQSSSGAPHAGTPPAPPAAKPGSTRSVTISVPASGDYILRVLPSADAPGPGELPSEFGDKTTTVVVDPAKVGKSPRIAVDDVRTGNTAIVPIPSSNAITLRTSDFDHVHRVEVGVTYTDKPVKTATVTLTTADKSARTKAIGPVDKGVAAFDDVVTGPTRVTVKYGDNLSLDQTVPLTSDHPTPIVAVPVAVATAVPTLDVAAPAGATAPAVPGTAAPAQPGAPPAAPPAAPASGGSGLVSLANTLIGLVVVAGALYLLYRWAQSGGMAATLKKAGIEVSGPPPTTDAGTPWQPNAPAPPVVTDPSLCQFCGQKKDAAGNCACTVAGAGGAAAVVPSPASAPSQPRLVGMAGAYSGSIFPLNANGSAVTLGRDPTNTISLGDDTTVSRRHASVKAEGPGYIVTDEGSSNGVYVNGVRISGSQALRPGDEVQIGGTRFRFEV